ncbi:hypothetical protein ACQPXT_01180 (plasmid) [Streptomyces sp. CA-100214]
MARMIDPSFAPFFSGDVHFHWLFWQRNWLVALPVGVLTRREGARGSA